MLGNIYKGKIKKVMKALDFAFIELGREKAPIMKLNGKHFSEGEEVLCQFIKLPIEDKGGEVTEHFSLSNDYFVLINGEENLKVSDKLDKDKKDLLYNEFLQETQKNITIIIRTECAEVPFEILKESLRDIKEQFEKIKKGIYQPIGTLLYNGDKDIKPFEGTAEFDLESKGKVTFERTKALVSIDIDSKNANDIDKVGKMAYIINKESISLIFKKIQELNINGIIIVDLLKCTDEEYEDLKFISLELAKNDKDNVNVYGITKLGLLEMTRNFKR